MIEAPTDTQKHHAQIAHAAQLLASGRTAATVIGDLKKRGMSEKDIEASWADIQLCGKELIRVRRRRVRVMGFCWSGIGMSLLGGIVWSVIFYGAIPFILILGTIPLAYGIYLLRLPATEEPSIDPPNLFGREL